MESQSKYTRVVNIYKKGMKTWKWLHYVPAYIVSRFELHKLQSVHYEPLNSYRAFKACALRKFYCSPVNVFPQSKSGYAPFGSFLCTSLFLFTVTIEIFLELRLNHEAVESKVFKPYLFYIVQQPWLANQVTVFLPLSHRRNFHVELFVEFPANYCISQNRNNLFLS